MLMLFPFLFHVISIHAPREGSDGQFCESFLHSLVISIHAPREGSDGRRGEPEGRQEISIHAPREGSDSKCAEK